MISSGGDSRPTGLGTSQGDTAYRRMTVVDGDNFHGERCELGFNNWSGPTALYHEGERRVTFISLRVPDVNGSMWRTVMQMKQAQGYRNPIPSPVLEMQAFAGKWRVQNSWNNVWSAPAHSNTWTRFAFDITYSQNPTIGSIKVYVDLNGDGDASDSGEESPRIPAATLRAETPGIGYSDYEVGESIPNHLRAGIYHNPDYNCSSGCSVDVDNVQVVGIDQQSSVPVPSRIDDEAVQPGAGGGEAPTPAEQPAPDTPPAAQPPPSAEGGGQTAEAPGSEQPGAPSTPTDVVNDLVRDVRETSERTVNDLGITGDR